ncbi:MAG: VOC family protein [Anaerolineae bacterium]|jgi:catechol 2,3-dioxygenase-like lactoylglutathione lyase family enzyme|nr:VOC family protein [Anaerolineae bacterium]
MKLTHVRLLVDNFDECFRFYRDVMGFAVQWGAEGSGYADFRPPRGGGMLALMDRRGMPEALIGLDGREGSAHGDHGMLVFDAADLDSTVGVLKARGAQFVADLTDRPDWGIRTAHLRDPDGNLIELNSPLPREQWADELADEAQRYTATGEEPDARGRTDIGETHTQQ